MSIQYKGTNITEFFSISDETTIELSQYKIGNNNLSFKTSTVKDSAKVINGDIGLYLNGTKITDTYNIIANSTTVTSTGNITVPNWCNSVKCLVRSKAGAQGTSKAGATGATGDHGKAGECFVYANSIWFGGLGGKGGPGGPGGIGFGGPGGAGKIIEMITPYIFSTKSINVDITTTASSITLGDENNKLKLIVNNGGTGGDGIAGGGGGKGNAGTDGTDGAGVRGDGKGDVRNWKGNHSYYDDYYPVGGTPNGWEGNAVGGNLSFNDSGRGSDRTNDVGIDYIYPSSNGRAATAGTPGTAGSTGNAGSTGTTGTAGTNSFALLVSTNPTAEYNGTYTSKDVTTTTQSVTVYFFPT